MSEIWSLFDSEEPVELKDAILRKNYPAALTCGDVVNVSSTPRKRVRTRLVTGEIASEHPYFASTSILWRAHELVDDSSTTDGGVRTFVASLTVDASRRAGTIAESLRGFQPEGSTAADALLRARIAFAASDWPMTLLSAVECMSAHSRQLDVGDWPNYSWHLSHIFALGFYIGARLSMSKDVALIEQNITQTSAFDSRLAHIATAEAMEKASYAACELVGCTAAGKLTRPCGSFPGDLRLPRVAMEALSMATLVHDASMIPTWLGTGILLAEKQCVEMKSWKAKNSASQNPNNRLVALSKGRKHISPYMVPATLPCGSPQLSPKRAVSRQPSFSLSVPDFFNRFVLRDIPVVITGQMSPAHGWSSPEQWRDLTLLVASKDMEDRLIPVEFGGFGDRRGGDIITLGHLVNEYLVPSNVEHSSSSVALERKSNIINSSGGGSLKPCSVSVAYMSQHALFHQCPDLQKMFSIPPYTLGRLQPDTGAINAWIGTKGTSTALHRDPYMNILAQTAGYKYVRLYSADQTKFLYAEPALRDGNKNSFERSLVAVEAPDFQLFPLFARAKYAETVLGPGDMLFIPKGTWHHVRSLTTSFSINFWWK
jgi:hypothetical protein|mmetsp:Transcript_12302/g.56956  ORF Transcript_12302/g.56956 Transcript_12302/m.56956 type:complete len:599 (-) Transcript_12302:347-2143(-)